MLSLQDKMEERVLYLIEGVSIEQIYFEFDNLNIEKSRFYLHT